MNAVALATPTLAPRIDSMNYRQQNLVLLVKHLGSQKALIEATGTNSASISTAITGKRPLGEGMARRIELKLKLPDGWMDKPNTSVPSTATNLEQRSILVENQALERLIKEGYDIQTSKPLASPVGFFRPDIVAVRNNITYAFEIKVGPVKPEALIAFGWQARLHEMEAGLILAGTDTQTIKAAEFLNMQGLIHNVIRL